MQSAIEAHKAGKYRDYLKYIHYSGHDSTLLSVFAALKLGDQEAFASTISKFRILTKLGNPNYGSAFSFELHYEKDRLPSPYFVKLVYQNGYNGQAITYALKSLGDTGCVESCPFDIFKK